MGSFAQVLFLLWLLRAFHVDGQEDTFSESVTINWTDISCGLDHTFGITQLGIGLNWGSPFDAARTQIPTGRRWRTLSAGIQHSCGLTIDSETLCWGSGGSGQLSVPSGQTFVEVALGQGHTCGLTTGNEVSCWGANNFGQSTFPDASNNDQFTAITAGSLVSCGIRRDQVTCWGWTGAGQTQVPFATSSVKWTAVSCGESHCCGIFVVDASIAALAGRASYDNVQCWGDNSLGQLDVPGEAEGRSGEGTEFQSIDAGFRSTCGVTAAGRVWCWGLSSTTVPDSLASLSTVVQVSAGSNHACLLVRNGSAFCWGSNNNFGELDVPIDERTNPPSILEYANDPADISSSDPTRRVTPRSDPPITSRQFVGMSLFVPEFSLPGDGRPTLTFERIGGAEDVYSPHVMHFTSELEAPGVYVINVSAMNLANWFNYTQLQGSGRQHPLVERVESAEDGEGEQRHRLVDGAEYTVTLAYRDDMGHAPAVHVLELFAMAFDTATLPPTITSPSSGFSTKQELTITYTLEEDCDPESLLLRLTYQAHVRDRTQQDTNSPHEVQLVASLAGQGDHTVQLNLLNLALEFTGSQANSAVAGITQAGRDRSSSPRPLVDGGIYTLTLSCMDLYFNTAAEADVEAISLELDRETEAIEVFQPSHGDRLGGIITIAYRLPEEIYPGSLEIEFRWLGELTGEALPDLHSPHRFSVVPELEVFGERLEFDLITSDLFHDPQDASRRHPNISSFSSAGGPAISFLQPRGAYEVAISYVDIFSNPRSTTTLQVRTNFRAPDAIRHVQLMAEPSHSSLHIQWERGSNGGVAIEGYDVQLHKIEIPGDENNNMEVIRRLLGAPTHSTAFYELEGSRHFSFRIRAFNSFGNGEWIDRLFFRTATLCGDGTPLDAEECDDGNLLSGDGCASDCTVEAGWICPPRNVDTTVGLFPLTSLCEPAGMDGIRVGPEECDDGNAVAGDGCAPPGVLEPFYACGGARNCSAVNETTPCIDGSDVCTVKCGDGLKHWTEACDDGNMLNNDGCSSTCQIESGFTCTAAEEDLLRTVCMPDCGDGVVVGSEECDDGNAATDDGCSNCVVQDGWFCQGMPSDCRFSCGNGRLDAGEECDDANVRPGDGCYACLVEPGWRCDLITHRPSESSPSSFCYRVCGDGFHIVSGPLAEECDDGNNADLDGCSADCRLESGFMCSPQVVNGSLLEDACAPICGDGVRAGHEACDDGGVTDGDGCSSACIVEAGYACSVLRPGEADTCRPLCGDGVVFAPETCDDGNIVGGDGCSRHCLVEEGYICTQSPAEASFCVGQCGDGLVIGGEECDDGNIDAGDGCSESCQLESGYDCAPNASCQAICGDGIRLYFEGCDDGNLDTGDGCDSNCLVESHWTCASFVDSLDVSTSVCSPVCGDGFRSGAEECDDANADSGDGCSSTCVAEAGFTCCAVAGGATVCLSGASQQCPTLPCGDGTRQTSEECDDGNTVDGDGCSSSCVVEFGYRCEASTGGFADSCLAICGDSYQTASEECDDGNAEGGDGCSATCAVEPGYRCVNAAGPTATTPLHELQPPTVRWPSLCRTLCGDGLRTGPEECDDGDTSSLDGCSRHCQVETGFRCAGGSLVSADTCEPTCGDGIRIAEGYTSTIEDCDTGELSSIGCTNCAADAGYLCLATSIGADTCHPVCGDGIVSVSEECDDNNTVAGDGCSPSCNIEVFWGCQPDALGKSECSIRCGDGKLHSSEECDDGNAISGDGCAWNCTLEFGYECLGGSILDPSTCRPVCGDEFQALGEECDDGNTVSLDGCNFACQVEQGYICTPATDARLYGTNISGPVASVCQETCGNGVLDEGEDCDGELPTNDTRACVNCHFAFGSLCGDGVRSSLPSRAQPPTIEECDDGNLLSGDGCDSSCAVEVGWACSRGTTFADPVIPDHCAAVCGDGLVVAQEECDDGNAIAGDGCSRSCQVESGFSCVTAARTASVCAREIPPLLVEALFDSAYVRLELTFSDTVAPLSAGAEFACALLFDAITVGTFGTGSRCAFTADAAAKVTLGGNPSVTLGSNLVVKSDVLRSDSSSQLFARGHTVAVGAPASSLLKPVAIITGPEVASACSSPLVLDASYSTGHGGRAFTEILWTALGAYADGSSEQHLEETARLSEWVRLRRSGEQMTLTNFPRAGFRYRVQISLTNFLGLQHAAVHTLAVGAAASLLVTSVTPQTSFEMVTSPQSMASLAVHAEFPVRCQQAFGVIAQGGTRYLWEHIEQTAGATREDLANNPDVISYARFPELLTVPAEALGVGQHLIIVTACVDVIDAQGGESAAEVCGSQTFTVTVTNIRRLSETDSARRLTQAQYPGDFSLRVFGLNENSLSAYFVALPRANDESFFYPQLLAEEPQQIHSLLQGLSTSPSNLGLATAPNTAWGGTITADAEMVLGAVLVGDDEGVANLWSDVTWSLSTSLQQTSSSLRTHPELGARVSNGNFLSIPRGYLTAGSVITVAAELLIHPELDDKCANQGASLRSVRIEQSVQVAERPAAGYVQVTVQEQTSYVRLSLSQSGWVSDALPLRYSFELEEDGGERRMLGNQWTFQHSMNAYYLPRSNANISIRGYVRDRNGAVGVTAPLEVVLSRVGAAQDIRLISEYQEGLTDVRFYQSPYVLQLWNSAVAEVRPIGTDALLQLVQATAVRGLGRRYDDTVSDCTADCPSGQSTCASDGSCLCFADVTSGVLWTGVRCERLTSEATVQAALTEAVMAVFAETAPGLNIDGLAASSETPEGALRSLLLIIEDCRRVSLEVLSMAAQTLHDLLSRTSTAGRHYSADTTMLIVSRILDCMPDSLDILEEKMPAPATILSHSGNARLCTTFPGTSTTACWDLLTPYVDVTCPQQACTVDVLHSLSTPYPCLCAAPDEAFLGYGRVGGNISLDSIMHARSEHVIMWRAVAKFLWDANLTAASTSTTTSDGPSPQELLNISTELWQRMGEEERQANIETAQEVSRTRELTRNVSTFLIRSAVMAAEAVALFMVPGEGPRLMSATHLKIAATSSEAYDIFEEADGTIIRKPMASITTPDSMSVEVELESRAGGSLVYPLAAVSWDEMAERPFHWLDSSREIITDIVQARPFGTQGNGYATSVPRYSMMRYRIRARRSVDAFACVLPAAGLFSEAALQQCCSTELSSTGLTVCSPAAPASDDSQGGDDQTSSTTTTSQAASTTTTSTAAAAAVPWARASIVKVEGRVVPLGQSLGPLLPRMRIWTPIASTMLAAGSQLRIRGGNLRLGVICSLSVANTPSITVLEGSLIQNSSANDTLCQAIRIRQALLQGTAGAIPQYLSTDAARFAFSAASILQEQGSTWQWEVPPADAPSCTGPQLWCDSGLTEGDRAVYADVLIEDSAGPVMLLDLWGVQVDMAESVDLYLGSPRVNSGGFHMAVYTAADETSLLFTQSMFSEVFTAAQVVEPLSSMAAAGLLRLWQQDTSTSSSSTTSTTTVTWEGFDGVTLAPQTTSATTSGVVTAATTATSGRFTTTTTTRTVWSEATSLLGGVLEEALGPYFDLLAGTSTAGQPWGMRLSSAAVGLDALALQAGSAADMYSMLLGFHSISSIVTERDTRNLGAKLQALAPIASLLQERRDRIEAGEQAVTPQQGTDCDGLVCAASCGVAQPAIEDFECVSFSLPLQRWVPALGCELTDVIATVSMDGQALTQLECSCAGEVFHSAVAVARRIPAQTPAPPAPEEIVTREYTVGWLDKLNRYNARGFIFSGFLFLAAVTHIVGAVVYEVSHRSKVNWVRGRQVQQQHVTDRIRQLDQEEHVKKKQLLNDLQAIQDAGEEGSTANAIADASISGRTVNKSTASSQPTPPDTLALPSTSLALPKLPTASSKATATSGSSRSSRSMSTAATVVGAAIKGKNPFVVGRKLQRKHARQDQEATMSSTGSERNMQSTTSTNSRHSQAKPAWEPGPPRPPPAASGRAIVTYDLAGNEVLVQRNDAVKLPLGRRIEAAIDRMHAWNVWQHCLKHHKLLFLNMDTQEYVCSAPERVAIFHMTLWIHALLLASLLHAWAWIGVGDAEVCRPTGSARWKCISDAPAVAAFLVTAVASTLLSNILLLILRGRSFDHLAKGLSDEERDKIFIRSFVEAWTPDLLSAEDRKRLKKRLWRRIHRLVLGRPSNSHGSRRAAGHDPSKEAEQKEAASEKRDDKKDSESDSIPWMPSMVVPCFVLLLAALILVPAFTMFQYSSTELMRETTYSSNPGYREITVPPLEEGEDGAVQAGGFRIRWSVVPQFQRYLLLLVLSWLLHLVVFEPMLLAFHLFIGSPTIDDCWEVVDGVLHLPRRFLTFVGTSETFLRKLEMRLRPGSKRFEPLPQK